jgi:GTP-binding protein
MKITSAKFIKGIVDDNPSLEDGKPQIAFIGRSNAGKSSLMNSITGSKALARTSKTPGRTQEINLFLINDTHYFLDLPGYGFAKAQANTVDKLNKLIYWYLFSSKHNPKVVVLIDAEVGFTKSDFGFLNAIEKTDKEVIIVANKVDKIKKSHYGNQIKKLAAQFPNHKLFPYSSKTKVGKEELIAELLSA